MQGINAKRKRTNVTLQQKQWLLKHAAKHRELSQADLVVAFRDEFKVDVPVTTVNGWLQPATAEKILQAQPHKKAARQREAQCPLLEEVLFLWFTELQERNVPVTQDAIIEKAKQLAEKHPELKVPDSFSYSQGWVGNFKKRHCISQYKREGEAGSADAAGVKHLSVLCTQVRPCVT